VEEEFEDRESPLLAILADPLGVVRRHRLPIAAVLALGIVGSVSFAALEIPQYAARATVLIASQKLSEEFVRPTIEEDILERINGMMAEVLSREKLTPLVEKYDLYPDLDQAGGTIAAVAALRRAIKVDSDDSGIGRGQRALILGIGFTAEDPMIAAEVANAVARLFVDAGVRQRTQQARLTTEFMRKELEAAEAALREQSREISEYQQKHRGELPSELEANLRRLERLQQQRNSLAMQITDGEGRLAVAVASAAETDSPEGRLRELRATLTRELAVNKETHPNVIALRRQIGLLEGQLSAAPDPSMPSVATRRVALDTGRRELAQLREQLASTDRELASLDAQVAATPGREEELSALLERAGVLRENYLDFLRKVKDAELAESLELAQQGDRVALLDAAFPPSAPTHERWKVAVAGIVGSFGLAFGLGVLLELRNPVIGTLESLESVPDVPVLGCVPRIV